MILKTIIKDSNAGMSSTQHLGLADGESRTKLIRRSVSIIVRKKLGADAWAQDSRMLGHHTPRTSDIYALSEPG